MWYARVVAVPGWDAAFLAATHCGGDACKAAFEASIETLADAWKDPQQPVESVVETPE